MSHTLHISALSSGGLITNYYCTSSCGHCLYRCSPLWPKTFIDPLSAKKQLTTIKNLGCNSIHIGGGEPLLNPDALIAVLDQAAELEINIDYVETNSSWFQKTDNACDLLHEVSKHGVTALLVSITPFHNEYIPFYKVKGVIDSCKKSGMIVNAWTWNFFDDINSLDDTHTHTLDEFKEHFGDDYIADIPQRYRISPGGRALDTFSKVERSLPVPALLNSNKDGCQELASVNHFHVDLFGNYIPGLCAGLSIRAEDLGQPLDRIKYPFLTVLYNRGIKGLLRLSMEEFGFEPSKALYYSKCELCFEIRQFLVCSAEVNSIELRPSEHYTLSRKQGYNE
jgi:hypothetical protein